MLLMDATYRICLLINCMVRLSFQEEEFPDVLTPAFGVSVGRGGGEARLTFLLSNFAHIMYNMSAADIRHKKCDYFSTPAHTLVQLY